MKTERDMMRAPMNVEAVATSEESVEVWWEAVPTRSKVIGYQVRTYSKTKWRAIKRVAVMLSNTRHLFSQIFYTMTAVEDLDEWQQKSVPLTESADLLNLEKFAQYAIAVAARTKVGLGRLSEKVTVKIKPEDVPLNLRAHDVSTHSMTLSWSPPIRLNPISYKVGNVVIGLKYEIVF